MKSRLIICLMLFLLGSVCNAQILGTFKDGSATIIVSTVKGNSHKLALLCNVPGGKTQVIYWNCRINNEGLLELVQYGDPYYDRIFEPGQNIDVRVYYDEEGDMCVSCTPRSTSAFDKNTPQYPIFRKMLSYYKAHPEFVNAK